MSIQPQKLLTASLKALGALVALTLSISLIFLFAWLTERFFGMWSYLVVGLTFTFFNFVLIFYGGKE